MTTILTRVCLDQLRVRKRCREEPLLADMLPADAVVADEHYLKRENISRALMVVLEELTPAQRVAYVLHDLFDVPFREVAETLGTSSDNAKKQASRARRRIVQTAPAPTGTTIDSAIVEAFLVAVAGGEIDRMVALITDDCMRVTDTDTALVPPSTPTVLTGARAVAKETTPFADRIQSSTPMLVDGRSVHVIAPGGHRFAVVDIAIRERRVARIDISRASAHTAFVMPSTTS